MRRRPAVADVHVGPAGANGPIVAFLFGFVPGGVTTNGVLTTDTISDADLTSPLEGTLAELAAMIDAGNAYVNVHTADNPGGELRDQIR